MTSPTPEGPVEAAYTTYLQTRTAALRTLMAERTHGESLPLFTAGYEAATEEAEKLEKALEAMREAGLQPTVYVTGPSAVKPWACGWSWLDAEGRSHSAHALGDTPSEAVCAAEPRALAPEQGPKQEGGQ